MRAYERLTGLLEAFREKIPGADFRECWGPGKAGRLPDKPVVTGQVAGEKDAGGQWSAELSLTVFLPRGAALKTGEELLDAMGAVIREAFPTVAEIRREGFGPDKASGLLSAECFVSFEESGGEGGVRAVIGGVERPAAGWAVQIDPGRALTAIGEEEPFAQTGGVRYTVEISGVDTRGLERLAGFTVEIGGQEYARCRWKSLDETGKSAVFTSFHRREGGE